MFVQSIFHLLLGGGGQRLIGSMIRCFTFNFVRHLSIQVMFIELFLDLNPVSAIKTSFAEKKNMMTSIHQITINVIFINR